MRIDFVLRIMYFYYTRCGMWHSYRMFITLYKALLIKTNFFIYYIYYTQIYYILVNDKVRQSSE